MTLGELRSQFLTLLNRDDCTSTLADTFLGQSIQRIQRAVRLPSMERSVIYSPTSPMESIQVPPDLIEPIDILVTTEDTNPVQYPLSHCSYRQLLCKAPNSAPRFYARQQAMFHIRGLVPAGSMNCQLFYFGEFSPLVEDGDTNEIIGSSPDLVTYGALSLAGDWADHPKAQAWEQRYGQFLNEVIQQAADLEMNGGPMSIASAHSYED